MRRFAFTLLLAAAVVALVVPQAFAKEHPQINVNSPPAHLNAGHPWKAELTLVIDNGRPWDVEGVTPAIEIQNKRTAKRKTFYAHRTSAGNVYRSRVVFPAKGSYLVTAWTGVDNPELPFKSFDARVGGPTGGIGWKPPLAGALALLAAATLAGILVSRTRRRRARALATA
jgi:hypothetical protein